VVKENISTTRRILEALINRQRFRWKSVTGINTQFWVLSVGEQERNGALVRAEFRQMK